MGRRQAIDMAPITWHPPTYTQKTLKGGRDGWERDSRVILYRPWVISILVIGQHLTLCREPDSATNKREEERERERERAGGGNKQERGREGESHEHLLQKQRNSSKKSGQHFLRQRRLSEEKVGKALSTFLMHTAHLLTLHTFLYLLYTPVHTLMYIIDFAYMTLHPLLYTHTVHTWHKIRILFLLYILLTLHTFLYTPVHTLMYIIYLT